MLDKRVTVKGHFYQYALDYSTFAIENERPKPMRYLYPVRFHGMHRPIVKTADVGIVVVDGS